jgi:acyl-CoA thioesterase-1
MTGRMRQFAALAVLAALSAAFVTDAARAADRCAAPLELTLALGPLPATAAAAKRSDALRVLIVGSGSSTNGGTTTTEASYPQKLREELARAFPAVAVEVQTRGGRGLTAADMLPILKDGLAEFRPNLVVWQSGTVDAVRGLDPDGFGSTLSAGADAALRAGADVVLMDMQFSRFSRATVNYGPFRTAMDAVAAGTYAVVTFPRYELMRFWAASGQIDIERAPRQAWRTETDVLHACLARKLAELIRDGMRQAGR